VITLSEHIRELARTFTGADKYIIHEVKIWFDGPEKPSETGRPDIPSPTTDKYFKWVNYRALFSDTGEKNFYVYEIKLNMDGKGQAPANVYDSAPDFDLDKKGIPSLVSPKEAERALSKYLPGPNLFPKMDKTDLVYINTNTLDREGKYSQDEFKKKYSDDFYSMQVPGNKNLLNPVTKKPVGVVNPPAETPEG